MVEYTQRQLLKEVTHQAKGISKSRVYSRREEEEIGELVLDILLDALMTLIEKHLKYIVNYINCYFWACTRFFLLIQKYMIHGAVAGQQKDKI
jgi:hypothetical protein